MSESTGSPHLRRCLLAASRFGFALRLFRQQSGQFFTPNGAPVRIGFPGLADTIGWRQVLVTPDMVGTTVAQFVAVEMKDGSGRLSKEQRHFLEVVTQAGGVALVARDPQDLAGLVAKGKTPG